MPYIQTTTSPASATNLKRFLQMESRRTLTAFDQLLKNRQEMRNDETRSQLKIIENNQRAAFLVRLFEQGEFSKVRKLAAAG